MISPEKQMCREELAFHMRAYNFSVMKIETFQGDFHREFLDERKNEIR